MFLLWLVEEEKGGKYCANPGIYLLNGSGTELIILQNIPRQIIPTEKPVGTGLPGRQSAKNKEPYIATGTWDQRQINVYRPRLIFPQNWNGEEKSD